MEGVDGLRQRTISGFTYLQPFILEIDDFSWIHSLSDGERSSLQSEIAEWHLCENNSDKDVKALFLM